MNSHPGLTSQELSGHEQRKHLPFPGPSFLICKKERLSEMIPEVLFNFYIAIPVFPNANAAYSSRYTSFIFQSLLKYLLTALLPRGEQREEGCWLKEADRK